MAKLFPQTQQWLDNRDGNIIGVTKVKLVSTGTDFINLGNASDAALLHEDASTADPTFYLSGNNNSIFNIDGGTVGDVHVIVSRHRGRTNFNPGD